MKKDLKLQKGETLNEWCARLSVYYGGRTVKANEVYQVLCEVSVKSYTHGSNDAIGAIKNRRI